MQPAGIFRGRPDDRAYAERCIAALKGEGAERFFCLGNVVGADVAAYVSLRDQGVNVMKGVSERAYADSRGAAVRDIHHLLSRYHTGDLLLSDNGFYPMLPGMTMTKEARACEQRISAGPVPLDPEGVRLRSNVLHERCSPVPRLTVMWQENESGLWTLDDGKHIAEGKDIASLQTAPDAPLLLNMGDDGLACIYDSRIRFFAL